MEVAKEAGALLSYDPNLREPLWPSKEEAKTQIMSIWDKAEIIKVSDVELEFLTGSNKIDDETALTLWHPNLKLLLVTLGEKGCRYYTKVTNTLEYFYAFTVIIHHYHHYYQYHQHSCLLVMLCLLCPLGDTRRQN